MFHVKQTYCIPVVIPQFNRIK